MMALSVSPVRAWGCYSSAHAMRPVPEKLVVNQRPQQMGQQRIIILQQCLQHIYEAFLRAVMYGETPPGRGTGWLLSSYGNRPSCVAAQ